MNKIYQLKNGRFIDLSSIISVSEIKKYEHSFLLNCFYIECALLTEKIVIIQEDIHNQEEFLETRQSLIEAWNEYKHFEAQPDYVLKSMKEKPKELMSDDEYKK